MLDRIMQKLYSKVFVSIVVAHKESHVYVEMCSGSKDMKPIKTYSKSFETLSLTPAMEEYIDSFVEETPYHYISYLDSSQAQGALPTCDVAAFERYADLRLCESRCVKNRWSFYTHRSEIASLERKYSSVGVDFIFSPFVLLSNFFKDKIDSVFALFVLVQANQMSLGVFDSGRLLFATHLDMHLLPEEDGLMSNDLVQDIDLDLDGGIDLEDITVDSDELELIDDFGDIEDLDALEEIDEFSAEKDIEEELAEASTALVSAQATANPESFNEDYKRFTLIQSAIATYYKDERFESRFLENIYMADGVGVGVDLRRYIEEELFVNVYIRQVDLGIELCELAKMELRG